MTDFDIFPDRIAEHCRKWDRKIVEEQFGPVPDDFIPMWIADMDFRAPAPLLERLHAAVDLGTFGYTYVYDAFYDAVGRYFQRNHHAALDRDWITLCYGTVQTLHFVMQAFCRAGDAVMLSTPVYEPFARAAGSVGANVIENGLVIRDNRYFIDFDLLEEQLRRFRPKLYLLCNPHNPSGRIWSRGELVRLVTLCAEYGAVVVSDEVHSGLILEGSYTSTAELGECFDHVILLSSPNKQYNLGGLKTSYAIVKDENIRKMFRDRLQKNSVTSPSTFGIIALTACYNECGEYAARLRDYILRSYRFAADALAAMTPALPAMKMESSYLLWVDIRPTGLGSDAFVRRLAEETGVLLESGNEFVGNGEGFVRMNLGTQFRTVREAFRRIAEFVKHERPSE